MKCHYEVLEVPIDVTIEDLKKAYRRAALKWHPDKNLDNSDCAKEQFQLVQQAYEVLSDSHERAWYDAHRDAILKGGLGSNYKDDTFDVFPYFTTSCFKGFEDDDKGFYSVYREVFNKIAAEESEYMQDEDSDFEAPHLGKSTSDFKEIVQPFYAYWQNFTTKKSFSWLDQYDIKDLPNRRYAKFVEKDNKKIRDKARKDRNEAIRNLVAFVFKRDKRVKAQARVAEEQIAENARIAEERRRIKLKERQQELQNFRQSEWSKFSNVEQELKNIEKSVQAEYGDSDFSATDDDTDKLGTEHDRGEDDDQNIDATYCPACQKLFKTIQAFANHENSKKHKENLEILRNTLLDEDACMEENTKEEDIEAEEEFLTDEDQSNEDDGGDEEEGANYLSSADQKKCEVDKNEDALKTDSLKTIGSFDLSHEIGDGSFFSIEKLKKKKTRKQKKSRVYQADEDSSAGEDSKTDPLNSMLSKKQRKKIEQQRLLLLSTDRDTVGNIEQNSPKECDELETTAKCHEDSSSKLKGKKAKEARKLKRGQNGVSEESAVTLDKSTNKSQINKFNNKSKFEDITASDTGHSCVTCASNFLSKNKLFDHLKKTGHAVLVPKSGENVVTCAVTDKKSGKGRKK